MRIRIDLAYDGTDFKGWARQPDLRTVQGELEAALGSVVREPVAVTCAGRTDTGVHARGQVVHIDLTPELLTAVAGRYEGLPTDALVRRLNGLLPGDIRVARAYVVPDEFDARFSALWRRYAYRIVDSVELVDPLTRNHVLAWPRALDIEAMNAASAPLVGLNDYASFCKKREGATTIRQVTELSWRRQSDGIIVGTVVADAFCHSMVRSLVGCLIAVGEGRKPVEWAEEVLAGRVRESAVIAAHGLTLEEVGYPADEDLGARLAITMNRRTEDELDG
ncbi:tRNA pseudouridine synthase A [Nocardioides baekrokdamisoli]|uniref:tRNA pseudouridine synthase A n=1 Tax=Nocardioides baekrokdamisoli TaxID=1804624 RepID=A0A3G9IG16_9ACTN|nr:tRNA pseudouridine(38-40) synthase TruA [Nocardioides baekrokdamisoli]BBH17927.1 tRNA pseudouridine synthase A [Nocardioides baekrokdamisoli]